MFEQVLIDSKTRDRYSQKRFASKIHSYLVWMAQRGYVRVTMAKHLYPLVSFSDYLANRGVTTIEEVPAYVSSFVHNWLQKSKKKGRTKEPRRLGKEVTHYIRSFLRFLEQTGELKPSPVPSSGLNPFLQKILSGFVSFCRTEKG